MNKIKINNLLIEVTRRCNMKCRHCLRGGTQSIDIHGFDILHLLEKVSQINLLTFSGGEPTLNVDGIGYTLLLCKRLGIEVNDFYIKTNGKKVSSEFLQVCLDWFVYIMDCNGGYAPEMSAVELSTDAYHEKVSNSSLFRLSALSFFIPPENETRWFPVLLNQGRAEKLNLKKKEIREETFEIEDNRIEEGTIYLNCKGEIIAGCGWSYKNQSKHKICDVKDFSLEVVENYIMERNRNYQENETVN